MAKQQIHTKFIMPENRIGELLTLDELEIIFREAATLIKNHDKSLTATVSMEHSMISLKVEDDLTYIEISQLHFSPFATVFRELGNKSTIKTPTAQKIFTIVKSYINS